MGGGPALKLTVEKGPQAGQTLERKPFFKFRIGKLVQGNNFTIKDTGVSPNHLFIVFRNSNWVLYDLSASNSTFLNGVQLLGRGNNNKTVSCYDLKDGDLIGIGDSTSIKVSIGVAETNSSSIFVENKGLGCRVGQLRRNPIRGAAKKQKQDNVVGGNQGEISQYVASISVSVASNCHERSNFDEETCCESKNWSSTNAKRLDLGKITLGEWFDYLEVILPKKIREETDEIIADMVNKAEKFKKFMLEQKNQENQSILL